MRIARGTATITLAVVAALTGTMMPAQAAQDRLAAGNSARDRVGVSFGSGNSLYVQVIPDGRVPMKFYSDAPEAWVFQGDAAALVGKSYTIRVENRGRSRIKVVVGVDGVNTYYRKPLTGTADRDVGSILGPGQTRVLTGFQADERTAQRFVFSPEGFSEGARVRGARIGEIEVHVYEEYRPEVQRSDRDRDQNSAAPSSAAPSPTIGTTAGDDVDSNIRRVSFTASTREPIARLELAYGRPEPEPEARRDDDRALGPLGVAVEQHPEGLRIVRVERDGLGGEMGLRDGDVITKVDTYARPSAEALRRVLRQKRSGDYLFLEVLRGRHVATFKARL